MNPQGEDGKKSWEAITHANPFSEACRVVCGGKEVLVSAEARVELATEPGQSYLLEPQSRSIENLPVQRITDQPFPGPGVRGKLAD